MNRTKNYRDQITVGIRSVSKRLCTCIRVSEEKQR